MTAYRYRVRDWDKHFENHRTRDLEYVRWLSVPNKQHGMGFTRIMAQADGRSIFGVWYLIIEACSQQRAPRLGWLTEDGRADGTPWTVEDMAERWRCLPAEIARALDVLCSPRIGWIETVENSELESSLDNGSADDVENSDSEKSIDVNQAHEVDLEQSAGEARGDRGENAKESRVAERPVEAGRSGDAPAAAAGQEDPKAKNREAVRKELARLRFMCSDSAVEDWVQFFTDAGCKTIAECIDCLHWTKRQARKDGKAIKWARHADGYETAWRNRPRIVEQSA